MKLVLKTLFAIFLLVAIAVAVLYGIGSGEYNYEAKTEIQLQKQDVYYFVTRPALMEQWMPNVKDVAIIDGVSEEILVDAEGEQVNFDMTLFDDQKSRVVVDQNGQEIVIISTLVEASYGNKLIYKLENPSFSATVRYEMKNIPNSDPKRKLDPFTELKQTMTVRYKGVACIFAPFVQGAAEKELKEGLANLKKVAEDVAVLDKYLEMPETTPTNVTSTIDEADNDAFTGRMSNAGVEAPERPDNPRNDDEDEEKKDEDKSDENKDESAEDKTDEAKSDEAKSDETKSDDAKADDAKADDTKADDSADKSDN